MGTCLCWCLCCFNALVMTFSYSWRVVPSILVSRIWINRLCFQNLSSLWGLVFLFVLKRTLWAYQVNLVAFKQPNLSPLILERFLGILGVAFQFYRNLGFHLVRWRVKVQQILSTRSWGSKPSLSKRFGPLENDNGSCANSAPFPLVWSACPAPWCASIMDSFQAKIGWRRMRKRENKKTWELD